MLGELPIEKYITHNFENLDQTNDLVHQLHKGDCLRGVLHIQRDYRVPTAQDIRVESTSKVNGGYLKKVSHMSEVNKCQMSFYIFLPEDLPQQQRGKPFPTLYLLSSS